MVHIFPSLPTSLVFEIVNPFSWISNAISSDKSCQISTWQQDTIIFPACWILIGQFKFSARKPYARWPILLEFGPIYDLLLFVTTPWWCRSLAKVTKWVNIEISKLLFVIPYLYNFIVSNPLFGHLSLIPKTPNTASSLYAIFLCVRPKGREGEGVVVVYGQNNWWGHVCGPLPKTFTLFMTKICDFPHPILDLKK